MKKKEAKPSYRPIHIPQLGVRLVHIKPKEVPWWSAPTDEVFRITHGSNNLDRPTRWKISNLVSQLIGRKVTPWVSNHLRIK